MGNDLMMALAESVGRMSLHTLNVGTNRATDRGLGMLLRALSDSVLAGDLRDLNL